MPFSARRSFDDPDQLAATVRAAKWDLVATGPGAMQANLMRADLHAVWMQSCETSIANTSRVLMTPDRAIMLFTHPGGTPFSWRGLRMSPGTMMVAGLGADAYLRSDGAARWASLSLPPEKLAEMGRTVIGTDLLPASFCHLRIPSPSAIQRLSWLHREVARLAREAPWVLTQDEPARSLEQAMIQALMACLAGDTPKQDVVARRHGQRVIARMLAVQEAAPDSPLHVPQICAAIGVSARTLRNHCVTHLGMGPNRYLRLLRLRAARRLLHAAEPGHATVTDIATRCGFWELGRFAVAYRDLFGESPSDTIRRAPDDARRLPSMFAA